MDLDAIAHNVCALRKHVGAGVKIFAALKADAYGFGIERVADTVISAGVHGLSVVEADHAIALRRRGISVPILLYGGTLASADLVAAVEQYDLIPTLLDVDDAQTYAQYATRPLRAFLKFDVGLERLGAVPEDAASLAAALRALGRIELQGVYTHLHISPNVGLQENFPYLHWQFERFLHALTILREHGFNPALRMAASSAVLMQTDQMHLNAIDPGHLLFGMYPSGPRRPPLDLRPAFRALKSRLVQVKTIQRPAFREQAAFPIRPDMRVGVFPCGISDGMLQATCGQVLVDGRRVPVLSVSLEHTRVDLTDVNASRGDEVVIVGHQAAAEITPAEVLEHLHQHIPSALPLAVHNSVPRLYVEDSVGD
ncbi:MAG: alanine racemase [Chloroflexi bacterium]|nr:alanine racemase [Chloroflexota bacterium]